MKTNILGVMVDALTFEEAFAKIKEWLEGSRANSIYTPNPEMIMAAKADPAFKVVLNSGSLVVPDGIGVVYASKLNKVKIKERVTGVDISEAIFEYAKDHGKSIYLFGSAPGIAVKAKCCLEKKFKGLIICGTSDGFYDAEKEKAIIEDIMAKQPDIIIVGTGMMKQETWIHNNMKKLGAKVLIGVGGGIDIYAGYVKRAPDILRKLGLEWLYRMVTLKRFSRQKAIPLFVLAVIASKFRKS